VVPSPMTTWSPITGVGTDTDMGAKLCAGMNDCAGVNHLFQRSVAIISASATRWPSTSA